MRLGSTIVFASLAAVLGTAISHSSALPTVDAKRPGAVLGITSHDDVFEGPTATLAWYDPLTLQALARPRVQLGGYSETTALSPTGRTLAAASCWQQTGVVTGIELVDTSSMRIAGHVGLPQYGCVDTLTWLGPRRLLALVATGTSEYERSRVVVVDVRSRRVVRRVAIPANPAASGHTRSELVLLNASEDSTAPARLAIVGADGRARSMRLQRIPTRAVDERGGWPDLPVIPGLAVDPDGGRAFVVPPSGPTAEVDLRTLGVSYHELDRPSFFRRLLDWLDPPAFAKGLEGPVRIAAWADGDAIVVAGTDSSWVGDPNGIADVVVRPAGTLLVDTTRWTTYRLTGDTSAFALAPGLVLAEGAISRPGGLQTDPGITAFDLEGRELWRLHPGTTRWLQPVGPLGYVHLGDRRTEVVDLSTGRVLRTLERKGWKEWPQLVGS